MVRQRVGLLVQPDAGHGIAFVAMHEREVEQLRVTTCDERDAATSRREAGLHPRRSSTFRRTTPATSPTTRASAPRCPASGTRSKAGAAVMVTSHLGRPDGRQARAKPIRSRRSRSASPSCSARPVPLERDWVDGAFQAKPGRSGAARELPLQQGREEERRSALAEDGGAVRRLRERRVRHRAPRRGDHARHRAIRAESRAPGR